MPRASGLKQILSPIEGLVSEQTPLAPLEQSTVLESNMDFSASLTTRVRRPGLTLEEGGVVLGHSDGVDPNLDIDDSTVVRHVLWDAVAEDSSISLHVFQVGALLYFFEDLDGAMSSHLKPPFLDLNDLKVSGSAVDVSRTMVDMHPGKGYLLVVSDAIEPHYLEYDTSTEVVTATPICIFVRDLDGIDDGLRISERPATLIDTHNYNLRNQGWGQTRRRISDNAQVNTTSQFFADIGSYPSNADIAHFGMIDNGSGYLRFDGEVIEDLNLGNTEAPKGHFIVNAFYIPYDDLEDGTSDGNPVCTLTATGSSNIGDPSTSDPEDAEPATNNPPDDDISPDWFPN